ncbi:MAG: dihydroorotate dehydrogenase electron transfer subunit [Candidatus Eremiobacteraeota bacterium]|nr:dihydroorotate dehydrogenase electron transfer subunit [Candidatus Eremiobacteraeota bacterium]
MPTLQSIAAVHGARVLDRTELAPGVIVLSLHAPELVYVTRPGHFVMVTPPGGQTAAVALGIYEAQDERASIMFIVAGARTHALAGVAPGATLDLFGPLGNGFDLCAAPRNVAIVAGGVGIASVLLPAQALIAGGARVRLFYGARTESLLVDAQKFNAAGCEVITATDDGTSGHHGFITEVLESSPDPPELILACGPSPMLRAVSRVSRAAGIPAQLSLEETFACGVGACWGCVVPIDRASAQAPRFPMLSTDGNNSHSPVYARICKEGPVFWAHELRW